MKYNERATKAVEAGLAPATVEDTCKLWNALGVSRQMKYYWRDNPDRVPLMAKLAAAWLIHTGHRVPSDRQPALKQCTRCCAVLRVATHQCQECGEMQPCWHRRQEKLQRASE